MRDHYSEKVTIQQSAQSCLPFTNENFGKPNDMTSSNLAKPKNKSPPFDFESLNSKGILSNG